MNTNIFQQTLVSESNMTLTENGAITHASTLDNVLDFFYHAPAKRGQADIEPMFRKALSSNAALATQVLFYLRDPRGGQGERDSFRKCLTILKNERPIIFDSVVKLVSEYGRWDDILTFTDSSMVKAIVLQQLAQDTCGQKTGQSISLLAKWMPSINTSSKETQAFGRKWAHILNMSEKAYRQ